MTDWDEGAIGRAFDEHHAELLEQARRILQTFEGACSLDAEDVVSEALARILKSRQTCHGAAHFFQTMIRAMRMVVIDELRRSRGRESTSLPVDLPDLDTSLWDGHVSAEKVHALLRKGDEELEQLVHARVIQGLTMRQCADVLGWSLRKVERLWAFSMFRMRRHGDEGIADDEGGILQRVHRKFGADGRALVRALLDGQSLSESAEVIGLPLRRAERLWVLIKEWLRSNGGFDDGGAGSPVPA